MSCCRSSRGFTCWLSGFRPTPLIALSAGYRDQHAGRSLARPALGRLEWDIIIGKVGTVVVWSNDRIGRRARQLLALLEDLDERKIDYISVRDGHLTGDSASAKMFPANTGRHGRV